MSNLPFDARQSGGPRVYDVLSWPTDPRLVEAICRLLDNPDVRDSVAEILGGLNLYPKVQAKLLSYLDSHPDALVSGRSDGPASRLRLLKALADVANVLG